jgi:hypothetical protein
MQLTFGLHYATVSQLAINARCKMQDARPDPVIRYLKGHNNAGPNHEERFFIVTIDLLQLEY